MKIVKVAMRKDNGGVAVLAKLKQLKTKQEVWKCPFCLVGNLGSSPKVADTCKVCHARVDQVIQTSK